MLKRGKKKKIKKKKKKRNHRGPKEVAQYFSSVERKSVSTINLYQAKVSLRHEGEMGKFPDKGKQRPFVTSRATVKE